METTATDGGATGTAEAVEVDTRRVAKEKGTKKGFTKFLCFVLILKDQLIEEVAKWLIRSLILWQGLERGDRR